jgi:hypothetical protein
MSTWTKKHSKYFENDDYAIWLRREDVTKKLDINNEKNRLFFMYWLHRYGRSDFPNMIFTQLDRFNILNARDPSMNSLSYYLNFFRLETVFDQEELFIQDYFVYTNRQINIEMRWPNELIQFLNETITILNNISIKRFQFFLWRSRCDLGIPLSSDSFDDFMNWYKNTGYKEVELTGFPI